ncbi:MAG: hypothetical protein WB952_25370 [Terriglobales bacterium]
MGKIAVVCLCVGFLTTLGYGQVPGGNVFIGYSYLNADLISGSRTSLNGWNGSVEGKVLPFIGLVADFSGHYGSPSVLSGVSCIVSGGPPPAGCNLGNVSASEHNFLFGPRVSFPVGKFRPFVHALIGAGHISESASGLSTSSTSFADALGGGIDYHLIPLISWRIQADALQTRFYSSTQNNIRISTGIAFHF